ncbi:MAG: RagB/SusD family nutrient uptake outer membrane protein [Chitinophagaceae bacterium]
MRTRYIYLLICLPLLLGTASCKKWADLKPSDGIISENYWQTKEQVLAAVVGCYSSLLADPNGKSKQLPELLFLWGELRADMLATTASTTAEEIAIMNVNAVSSNTITDWTAVYRTINYCNIVIDYAPKVLDRDKTFTEAALNAYLSEAKALRALMYFYLVRTFGDVPLKLASTSNDNEIVSLAKSSKDEVLAQIIKDLNEAETGAVLTYGIQSYDKGRITRYTINTIQADVYLWMDKYNECVTACNKVIDSKKFGMLTSSTAWFTNVFRNGNSNESIFEFQYSSQKLNTFYTMFAVGSKRFIASNRVMDMIYGTDESGSFKDIRGDGCSVRAEDNLIWKYVGKNGSDLIASGDSYTHWFAYRYPDVLLMKAEALAELNQGAEALSLVESVRTRAQALQVTNDDPDPSNKEAVAQFVLAERSREFMFEGKRWFDVLRYVKRNNYARIDYLMDMISNVVPANMIKTAQAKLRDANSNYLPIYDYELQTNKLLVQNPFYK